MLKLSLGEECFVHVPQALWEAPSCFFSLLARHIQSHTVCAICGPNPAASAILSTVPIYRDVAESDIGSALAIA